MPVGYKTFAESGNDPKSQIGTGAYILKSFTPGQQSMHEKNPNYWRRDSRTSTP